MKTLLRSAGLALLAIAVCAPTAEAQLGRCQRSIAKANSQYLQAIVKAQSKCEGAVVKSGVGSCPDSKAQASIDKAEAKLASTIGKSCGGGDKVCNGAGTIESPEFDAGDLSWPSACPNFEKGDCTNAISDCGDIATCLACIGASASDQAMSLYYDNLVPGTQANKTLNKCQITIGKAASAFLNSKSKALQKCWDARLNGKHSGDCFSPSGGDGKYAAAVTKARDKMVASICKACGGPDKLCGQGDDLTLAAIGFPSECSLVTPPGGASCSGTVSDLQGIVDCVECVTGFKGDCDDRLAVPQFTPYPTECNSCTLPPLTGACPTTLSFTADGTTVDLDTGFTGLAHDATVPTNGRVTLTVSNCDSVNHPGCGECDINGPIPNGGGPAFDNHRCQDAPWQSCSVNGDCTAATACLGGDNNGALCTNNSECDQCGGGPNDGATCANNSECPGGSCGSCTNAGFAGPCVYFFGAPLPLRAGGVSTCVMNRITGPVVGTVNIDTGATIANVPLASSVHPVGGEFDPCPHCEGGVCVGHGPRIGQACIVNGTGIFGDVSLDCPPNPGSNVGTLLINLNIATGVQSKTVEVGNATCRQTGFTGLKCLCDSCNDIAAQGCSVNGDCDASAICVGGSNNAAPCSGASECPGGACGAVSACIGGANDGTACSVASECPGGTCGAPGICGGKRCIGGTEAGQACGTCIGGSNHGANCNIASVCPGGACMNPRELCFGGSNDGGSCTNNSACPGGTCAECAGGGNCNRPGEATQPNSCNDDTTTPGLTGCASVGNNEGECPLGPDDQVCSIQTFRNCLTDDDCDPVLSGEDKVLPGQTCISKKRECFTDNGVIGNSVQVAGAADTPCGDTAKPVVGTFFCVAPVGAAAVNAAGGLPALGRVRIPGVVVIDPAP